MKFCFGCLARVRLPFVVLWCGVLVLVLCCLVVSVLVLCCFVFFGSSWGSFGVILDCLGGRFDHLGGSWAIILGVLGRLGRS